MPQKVLESFLIIIVINKPWTQLWQRFKALYKNWHNYNWL